LSSTSEIAQFDILLFRFQSLSIHCLTTTREAAETVLQKLSLTLCHSLKDDLIVVASKFLDAGSDGFETLTASCAFPMLTTFLQPERLHGSTDLLLNFLTVSIVLEDACSSIRCGKMSKIEEDFFWSACYTSQEAPLTGQRPDDLSHIPDAER
jgi:hypothetical protein